MLYVQDFLGISGQHGLIVCLIFHHSLGKALTMISTGTSVEIVILGENNRQENLLDVFAESGA